MQRFPKLDRSRLGKTKNTSGIFWRDVSADASVCSEAVSFRWETGPWKIVYVGGRRYCSLRYEFHILTQPWIPREPGIINHERDGTQDLLN